SWKVTVSRTGTGPFTAWPHRSNATAGTEAISSRVSKSTAVGRSSGRWSVAAYGRDPPRLRPWHQGWVLTREFVDLMPFEDRQLIAREDADRAWVFDRDVTRPGFDRGIQR